MTDLLDSVESENHSPASGRFAGLKNGAFVARSDGFLDVEKRECVARSACQYGGFQWC